jgi:hypothetical protein
MEGFSGKREKVEAGIGELREGVGGNTDRRKLTANS